MLEWILNLFSVDRTFGATRSNQWPAVRAAHLAQFPNCAVCGGNKKVEVHHKQPFHINPALELDPSNLITLCEGSGNGNHHLLFGHLGDFKSVNAEVEVDSKVWFGKIATRP